MLRTSLRSYLLDLATRVKLRRPPPFNEWLYRDKGQIGAAEVSAECAAMDRSRYHLNAIPRLLPIVTAAVIGVSLSLATYFAIAVGGTLGCWARYAMTNLVQTVYGRDFPYATLSINLLGSFLMGFLFIETLDRLTISPALRTGILTGVLGGYTTFSTFEMETLLLVEQGEPMRAVLYIVLSVVLGFLCAFGGAYIARNL